MDPYFGSMFFQNLLKPFSKPALVISYMTLAGILFWVWSLFNQTDLIRGNHGAFHANLDIFLSIVTIFLFPLLIVGILYRSLIFGQKNESGKGTLLAGIGGLISVIISGSTCCGLTIASMLGFLPIMTSLPGSGIELKTIGVLVLIYGVYDLYAHLETCQLQRKKPKK